MDAYLSVEAHRLLTALTLIPSRQSGEGLIIGHQIGSRYFVERVYLLPHLFNFLPQKFFELDDTFKNKLIGFWGYNLSPRKIDKILAPFACGKLFLELNFKNPAKLRIKSFLIEYKDKFFLSPINLRL